MVGDLNFNPQIHFELSGPFPKLIKIFKIFEKWGMSFWGFLAEKINHGPSFFCFIKRTLGILQACKVRFKNCLFLIIYESNFKWSMVGNMNFDQRIHIKLSGPSPELITNF